jgi:ferrous iron transport protein A
MCPLGLLSNGEFGEIMEIREGRQDCHRRAHGVPPGHGGFGGKDHQGRMADMGLRVGKSVEMIRNGGDGAIVVKVDESRIAMARGMAMKILVERK